MKLIGARPFLIAAGRFLCCLALGVGTCAVSGGFLGGLLGGCANLYDFPDQYKSDGSFYWIWREFSEGMSFGSFVGKFLGGFLGLLLFSGCSWQAARQQGWLQVRGSRFREMIAMVPAGQAMGSLAGILSATLLQVAWALAFSDGPARLTSFSMKRAIVDGVMVGGPLGMLAGGACGWVLVTNRARNRSSRDTVEL